MNQHAQHEATSPMDHGEHAGHGGGHAGHADMFRIRFWISLALSIPVILFSEMVQEWLRFDMPDFAGSEWIGPVFGTIIVVYGGAVFLTGGWDEIRKRQPGMMLLISLAIIVAFLASAATSLGWFDLEFWWELALLVTIMLLGHWQEMKAIGQAQGALDALAALLPDEAERITESGTEIVPLHALGQGDLILVRPGSRVPADGAIEEGTADVDESMITGESRAIEKSPGDKVVAGTVVSMSALRVRVEAVGEATSLAGIQRLVEAAQQSRSRAQALADRFAALLFYIAAGSGLLTFIVWTLLGDVENAVIKSVTVLVISCPHALGLAIPLVISISTSVAAKNGILVKDRLDLERMRTVDTVLFDKTGTLTRGEPMVTSLASLDGNDDALLALAAAVEWDSEHPLARAIVTAAQERGVTVPLAKDFQAIAGRGVRARVGNQIVAVGGPAMLRELKPTGASAFATETDRWSGDGAAVLHLIADDDVIGAFAIEDTARPESRAAVDSLHELGIKVVMITGDARSVAEHIAQPLGIDEVYAEVLPEDKQNAVRQLQQQGRRVAMVGDGVNDAPALAQADVGIAIGAGTDVAIESAGIILATSDPRTVVGVRRLSAASWSKSLQNLVWAAGYNIVAIPLAAGVLAPIGIEMPPAVGALLMSVSTIVVALNAQVLRHVHITD
ncbi:MAG: heavy metal translocating P-type ATPase [Thermomicrobiales bacterium]